MKLALSRPWALIELSLRDECGSGRKRGLGFDRAVPAGPNADQRRGGWALIELSLRDRMRIRQEKGAGLPLTPFFPLPSVSGRLAFKWSRGSFSH